MLSDSIMPKRLNLPSLLYLLILFFSISACTTPRTGEQIDFSVLSSGNSLREATMLDESPKLIVISKEEDIDALTQSKGFTHPSPVVRANTDNVLSQVWSVDLQQNIAILAFRGMHTGEGRGFFIEEIRLNKDIIRVYTQFIEPTQWYERIPGFTRPEAQIAYDMYSLISVPKQAIGGRVIAFELVLDNRVIYEDEMSVP